MPWRTCSTHRSRPAAVVTAASASPAACDADPAVANHRTNPPPACSSDDFRAGFKHLAPRNLSFELWLYHPQIPDATSLARAFPDTTMILNHFGGPIGVGTYAGKGDEVFAAVEARH